LVFTDVEGSTRLLVELGEGGYRQALAAHRDLVRGAFGRYDGYEVDNQGDSFFFAFTSARGAVAAVEEAMEALDGGPIAIRVGVHTGEPILDPPKYVGTDVHLAARIMGAGHGGQVLLSGTTRELIAAAVRDLGLHRLKDFAEPVRLYQLGERRFPSLKTISSTNLPRPLSSFVGREHELADVASLVRDGARLLTLLGPGGTGKTRLALAVAEELVGEFPAGLFWVELAPIRDPALVREAVAETLGARQTVSAHIGEKELLLVLDNLEQVVEAAPELAELLEECPNLVLLVTSRERLRVRGEMVYAVPALAPTEGVELFSMRAQVDPDEVISELCRRLDNLPLALELAAARSGALTPEQILERISERLDLFRGGRDADPRQRTLRGTILWSYELLPAVEQRLFSRLAVFDGGCTLASAEEVVGADVDGLQALLDKSLLRRSGDRFWMLETIREYAAEQLAEDADAERLIEGHTDHYLAMAERAYAEQFERGLTWVRLLAPEQPNLRRALARLESLDGDGYLQLAGALGWFWDLTSQFADGARRLDQALAATSDDSPLYARALAAAGTIARERGEYADSEAKLENASALWNRLGNETEYAAVRNQLGWALYAIDHTRALTLFEETLVQARNLGHQPLVNRSLSGICQALIVGGDYERAEPLAEELKAATHDTEDIWCMGSADIYLSLCAWNRGDFLLAQRVRRNALESSLRSGDVMQQTIDVLGLALAAAALGRSEEALQLEGAVDAKWKGLGVAPVLPLAEPVRERLFGAAHAALGAAAADAAYADGEMMSWEQAVAVALGWQAAASGDPSG
jgi:predicted ATPase